MKTLHLNLIKKWFDMIFSGVKEEEYRDITPYWCSKFLLVICPITEKFVHYPRSWWTKQLWLSNHNIDEVVNNLESGLFKYKEFDTITFSNGMTPPVPRFEIKFSGIEIKEGKPEWGAIEGKKYFTLTYEWN